MDAHRFIQNLIGSLIPNNDHPMDDAQMPPLEPIIHNQPSTSHSTSNLAAAEAPETPADDVHMQPAQSRSRTHNDNEEDADSMPDLQSVSNSSDEESSDSDDESGRDANEVEMQAVQDDDNDSAWTDEDDDMPGLERINVEPAPAGQRRTNRRPRVEDDQDDERDRRHPSQRVADTMSINEPPPSTVPSTGTATPVPAVPQLPLPQPLNPTQNGPSPTNQPTPGPLPPIPPHMLFRIPLARFRATTQNAPGNANNNNNNNNTNNANNNANANFTGQPMIGGFAITIDNNGMPVLHAHPPHQHAHPDGNGNGDPNANAEPQAPGGGGLPQDLSALFNLFGNAIGIGFGEREQEDPERAKRLVDALEEVPVGLVRRLGRVGGGQLAGEEGAGASGGDGGCAICWDSLLDGDLKGEGWTTTKKDGIAGEAATEVTLEAEAGANPILESSTSTDTVVEASSSSDSVWKEAKSSAENESKSNSEPEQPKIVSMPCAHVFHAACLIPWFSRPRQTTCPTCRFNIDPENLTYVRRRAPAPPNGGNNGNAVPGMGVAQTQTQGGEQAHPQARDAAQPPHTLHAAGLRLPTPAGFNPGGVGPIPTNANAGGDPNPNNPPQFFAFSPEHFEQASRDILADTRVELAASIASAQAARDNALAPSAPGTNTLDDPRSGNVAAAAALERAETSLARVEQWLDRVGMAGGLLTRLGAGAGVLHGQGLGQRLGPDANTGVNENVGTTPATANNVNAEGGETTNDAPAGAPAITTAILLDRLAALETAIGRVTDLSNALAPTANAEATPANAEAPPAPGVNAGPGTGAPPHAHIPPNNNGPGMGFVTFGFDVIIGANGNMDADGEGMMDGNGGEGDMMIDDDRWVPIPVMVADDVRDGPGGNEDELPPLEPIQGLHPAPLQSNAATARNNDNNTNSTPGNAPTAAPNQNPNVHFQPFGMGNMGPGVHVATGTGRTLNEAMASLFGGWGQDQGQQQQQHPGGEGQAGQGVPQQQAPAQGGVPPHAGDGPPTQPATPVDENGLGAQNGVGPGGVPTMQNFFSALLGSVPQGGVGRINPISVGGRGAANPGPGQGQNQGQDAPLPQPAGTQANPGIPAPPNANPGNNNNNVDWEQFFPLPPFQPGEVNGNGAQAGLPPFTALFGNGPAAMPQGHAPPHPHAHAHMHAHPPFMSMPGMGPRRAPREKKAWTLPPPPGPTLRQRVERKEREAGMRCHDLSCGVGPSDDEPLMAKTDTMMNQLSIHPLTKGLSTEVCAHMFHTSCLVSSERVALMGELPTATGEDVEVSCPVCRVAGCISKASWDEGVQALA